MWVERISVYCFGASYALALLFELIRLIRPHAYLRLLSNLLGGAGLLAHTLFLAEIFFLSPGDTPLASQFGALLFVAWILAIFYLYGSLHHRRQAWGVFVLPLVLFLVALATVFSHDRDDPNGPEWLRGDRLLPLLHGVLLLLAAVGVCVGFVASVMYLVQAHRLRNKSLAGMGIRLLSLERLEAMIRHAIMTAFSLLPAGAAFCVSLFFSP